VVKVLLDDDIPITPIECRLAQISLVAMLNFKPDHLLNFWFKPNFYDYGISDKYRLTGFGTLDFGCISFLADI